MSDEEASLLFPSESQKRERENEREATITLLDEIINENHFTLLFALSLAVGNAADAVEVMCIGYIMNEINEVTTQEKEFLSAAVFIGMLLGGLLAGVLADQYGRKLVLQYSLFINLIASISSAFAPSISLLIFCRVIGGIGIGGSVPTVFTLGAELFPIKVRGKLLSLIASFWMVGAIYVGLFGWIMLGNDFHGDRILPHLGWRSFALVSAIPVFIAFLLSTFIIPESPRYLVTQQQYEKAAAILSQISQRPVSANQLHSSITSDHLPLQRDQPRLSSFATFLIQIKSLSRLFEKDTSSSTALYLIIWFTLCFGSYGLSTWISVLFDDIGMGNVYLSSFIFSLANLPGNIFSIFFIESIGRKKMLAYGMICAAISALGFGFGSEYPVIVVLSASLFNGFSVVGWNALDCMSVENFPTEMRTSAMGLLAAAGRLGAITAQFVNGTLENNIAVLLFVTSGCMFIGGFASFYTPADTTGKSLGRHE